MEFKTCWRCGVEFDQSPYRPDAPCEDCQYDMPDEVWTKGWTNFSEVNGRFEPMDLTEREQAVIAKWKLNRSDPEIAEALGISPRTVLRYRKRLGLPAITVADRPDIYAWKDKEAQRQHARDMVRLRKTTGRGSLGRYHIKD